MAILFVRTALRWNGFSCKKILAGIKQSDRAEISISVNSAELWSAVNDGVTDLLAHLMGKKLSTVKWIDRERTDWDLEFVNKRIRLILMIQVFRYIDLETHTSQVRSIFQESVSESIRWALLVPKWIFMSRADIHTCRSLFSPIDINEWLMSSVVISL